MATEPNDIDLLMSLDPLEYSKTDIDIIIAYHRNQRALREKGVQAQERQRPQATPRPRSPWIESRSAED